MKVQETLTRLMNWPTSRLLGTVLFIAAIVVVLGPLLFWGTRRWIGRGMAIAGLIAIMVSLVLVREQTVTERQTEIVSATRPRYSERARFLALAGLLTIPLVAGLVASIDFVAYRRKRRAGVPHVLKAGLKNLYEGDYEAALLQFNQAIHIAPELAEGYCRRASVYRAMGHSNLALADLDRALQQDPWFPAALLDRGKVRTELGDLDGAVIDFGHLLKVRGADPEFYLNRGVCLLKRGLIDDAANDFRRVIKMTNHSDFAEPAKVYLSQCIPGAVPQVPYQSPGAYSS
jgi:tetratricopeptide (TPR) repeat protein